MKRGTSWIVVCAAGLILAVGAMVQAAQGDNLFTNSSFEMGRQFWGMDKAGKTVAKFDVAQEQAPDGQSVALLTLGEVEQWGVQFGQKVTPGEKGKTYTFAVMARSAGDPVKLQLEIERCANPYDRAFKGDPFIVKSDQWTEMHVTFKVEKDFSQGWFAYVSCAQANASFKLDAFRLYEGTYVPLKDAKRESASRATVSLFDTGKNSAAALAADAISKRADWKQVAEDKLDHAFAGDAVVINNRLAIVLRGGAPRAELYSIESKGACLRGVLRPVGGAEGTLAAIKTLENNPGQVTVQATYRAVDGKTWTTTYDVKTGQPFVQVEPGEGAGSVRVEAPCRFAVMPDFFADDIIVDAAALPAGKSELPSENFLLQMLGDGEAMLMSVWTQRDEDVRIAISGSGDGRKIDSAEIPIGKKGKLWVAVLAQPGLWHTCKFARSDANKIIPLTWAPPMPAHWRIDLTRDDGFSDSWEFILQQPGGDFLKSGLVGTSSNIPASRKRWNTVLGSFLYPCWIEKDNKAYVQPLKSAARFEGPALVYPIARARNTPLDAFTVIDIVRATMGVGPCEYVLDVEGQHSQYKGRATCANRDTLMPIYTAGQQKQKRAEVERSLLEVMVFVHHIRDRIEAYLKYTHDMRAYLASQKQAHPELAAAIDQLDKIAQQADQRLEQRRDKIKTPDQAQALVDGFKRDGMNDEGPAAVQKCKKFALAMVEIGGNQDELVGECRLVVRMLRQRAALLMAADPRMAEISKQIRSQSQKVLRNPAGHEGAGH